MATNKSIRKTVSIIIAVLLLASCGSNNNLSGNKNESIEKINNIDKMVFKDYNEKIGDNIPITRAETAKIIALMYSDTNMLEDIVAQINFLDMTKDDWYYAYASYCANNGYMRGDGVSFRGNDKLTLNEASYILDLINPNAKNKLSVTDENKNKPISYGLWCDLFVESLEQTLDGKTFDSKYKLSKINCIILATSKDNKDLTDYVITDNGLLKAKNLDMSVFRDTEISIYTKNGEIVMLDSFITDEPTIKNAYVFNYTKDNITIFTGGVYRDYKVIKGSDNNINGSICDIKVSGNTAKSLSVHMENANETIRAIDDKNIKLTNGSSYKLDDNFKIYGTYGKTLTYEDEKSINVGSNMKFIFKGDEIISAIYEEKNVPRNMRVILNTTGFGGTTHKSVKISSTNGFYIENTFYDKDTSFEITEDNYKNYIKGEYIQILPKDNGLLQIDSVKKANDYSPVYRGTLEICKVDGGFNIISCVSLDEYLYQVVPSEMPSSYGLSASMAQAICARTYAYKQYFGKGYQKLGANVDDSTNCQVYNNIKDNDISREAVDETTGLVITYDNTPIDAFFFSTTGGTTASVGDVWTSNVANFPSESKVYLKTTKQYEGPKIDLQNEENAYKFYKNTDISAVEKDVDWFRWNYTLKRDELSTSINNNLKDRYAKRPDLILTLTKDGTYKSEPIDSVGLVKDINIISRGEGGNVIEMDIIGTDKTVKVYTELNVRSLLKPYQYIIDRAPITLNMVDKTMQNYSLMPSAFFTMDKVYDENNNIKEVTFFGGGNGHGVGLSQNGCAKLIESGITVNDAILHYYPDSEVEKIGEF